MDDGIFELLKLIGSLALLSLRNETDERISPKVSRQ